jgi:hypothetical protein
VNYLYVDANIYLGAYKTSDPAFHKHVRVLVEHARSVFVSQQIVDEVDRNKLKVAADFVDEQLKKLNLPKVSLPGFSAALTKTLKDLDRQVESLQISAGAEASKYLVSLASSQDATSKLLEPLFALARPPSEEVLRRARLRKERGNPPGKRSDPLGDQISWEQLLDLLQVGDCVHIVSKDKDYYIERRGVAFLDPLLEKELKVRLGPTGTIVLCRSLVEVVKKLPDLPDPQATKISPAESEKAAEEELAIFDDHDDDYDICKACELDEDHAPHLVHWSIAPSVGRLRTGRCDWCNELSVRCVDCGFRTALLADQEETCDCEVSFRHIVERNHHGEEERDEVVILSESSS